jgi:cation:H+ antiporter
MDLLQYFAVFLAGVVLLALGANWLVRGAVSISETLGIPRHVVGLTVVALGTSAPELFVNLLAAVRGDTALALSNVSGSNLANVCVGFGLCAMAGQVMVRKSEFRSDLILVVVVPLLVTVLFFTNAQRHLPLAAIPILTLSLVYYLYTLRGRNPAEDELDAPPQSIAIGLLFFVIGVVSLYFGGELVVGSAKNVALTLGVTESVIGLTIVAGGTSVPDVLASVIAARKKEFGIAVGNLLGSNISNLVVVLNGTIIISRQPLPTDTFVRLDYFAVILTSGLAASVAMARNAIGRPTAYTLLAVYFGYMVFRVMSQ